MVATAGSRTSRVPSLAKYDVLDELGHGGMATVYRAHDKRLGRDVAIKVLHPHLRESREIAHRFAAEAKAVAKLRHPNIVEVFDVSGQDDDEQFLVVELVRGRTLRQILQQRGALPPEIAVAISVELLSALVHAHASGVVHRDVKPENVLVEHRPAPAHASEARSLDDGAAGASGASASSSRFPTAQTAPESRRSNPASSEPGARVAVKLTDFGIAKLLDAQGVTSTGQVLGSPAHMAPEQIEGGEVDGRADVFGMGVLLYECLVGHLPFEGNNPAQVLRRVLDGIYPSAERERPLVGKAWSRLVDRALARRPEDRFESAQAMRDGLLAELARVGFVAGRSPLQAFLDGPEAWVAAHETAMIARLCELGGDARRRRDAVAAAADYNRALAYAPSDPQLIRIVTSMHRVEERQRLVKRLAPLALGALVMGGSAYALARTLKSDGAQVTGASSRLARDDEPRNGTRQAGTGDGSGKPVSGVPVVVAGGGTAPKVSTAPRTTLAIATPAPTTPKRVTRTISGVLSPRYGVHMTIDGDAARAPEGNFVVTLDEKPHVLAFTCRDAKGAELCVSKSVNVPSGDKDEAFDVTLQILPARLLVQGPAGSAYGIEEMPGVTLAAGVAADVPMPTGAKDVTVYDRADPSRRKSVRLLAGKAQTASLDAP
jgi:serine/threonine-protein kinase